MYYLFYVQQKNNSIKLKIFKDNILYFIKDTQEIYLGKLRMGIGKLSDEDSVYIDKYKIMMGE